MYMVHAYKCTEHMNYITQCFGQPVGQGFVLDQANVANRKYDLEINVIFVHDFNLGRLSHA